MHVHYWCNMWVARKKASKLGEITMKVESLIHDQANGRANPGKECKPSCITGRKKKGKKEWC